MQMIVFQKEIKTKILLMGLKISCLLFAIISHSGGLFHLSHCMVLLSTLEVLLFIGVQQPHSHAFFLVYCDSF